MGIFVSVQLNSHMILSDSSQATTGSSTLGGASCPTGYVSGDDGLCYPTCQEGSHCTHTDDTCCGTTCCLAGSVCSNGQCCPAADPYYYNGQCYSQPAGYSQPTYSVTLGPSCAPGYVAQPDGLCYPSCKQGYHCTHADDTCCGTNCCLAGSVCSSGQCCPAGYPYYYNSQCYAQPQGSGGSSGSGGSTVKVLGYPGGVVPTPAQVYYVGCTECANGQIYSYRGPDYAVCNAYYQQCVYAQCGNEKDNCR
jgi:hypothetical protein